MTEKKPWPTEIRVAKDRRSLAIAFDDGSRFEFPAEFLRVESPSAEVKGHGPGQRQTVPGKRDVMIIAAEQTGNYAVRLSFDDMHNTGIYTWDYFRELAGERDALWKRYLDELAEKGLSRDPGRR